MIDIESKIISCREDTNDYRLCLTREEIEEIKEALATCDTCIHKVSKEDIEQIRAEAIDECIQIVNNLKQYFLVPKLSQEVVDSFEQLKEQNK